jgi:hypothetical protein
VRRRILRGLCEAATMCAGVGRSGSPMPRSMRSAPLAFSLALSSSMRANR